MCVIAQMICSACSIKVDTKTYPCRSRENCSNQKTIPQPLSILELRSRLFISCTNNSCSLSNTVRIAAIREIEEVRKAMNLLEEDMEPAVDDWDRAKNDVGE